MQPASPIHSSLVTSPLLGWTDFSLIADEFCCTVLRQPPEAVPTTSIGSTRADSVVGKTVQRESSQPSHTSKKKTASSQRVNSYYYYDAIVIDRDHAKMWNIDSPYLLQRSSRTTMTRVQRDNNNTPTTILYNAPTSSSTNTNNNNTITNPAITTGTTTTTTTATTAATVARVRETATNYTQNGTRMNVIGNFTPTATPSALLQCDSTALDARHLLTNITFADNENDVVPSLQRRRLTKCIQEESLMTEGEKRDRRTNMYYYQRFLPSTKSPALAATTRTDNVTHIDTVGPTTNVASPSADTKAVTAIPITAPTTATTTATIAAAPIMPPLRQKRNRGGEITKVEQTITMANQSFDYPLPSARNDNRRRINVNENDENDDNDNDNNDNSSGDSGDSITIRPSDRRNVNVALAIGETNTDNIAAVTVATAAAAGREREREKEERRSKRGNGDHQETNVSIVNSGNKRRYRFAETPTTKNQNACFTIPAVCNMTSVPERPSTNASTAETQSQHYHHHHHHYHHAAIEGNRTSSLQHINQNTNNNNDNNTISDTIDDKFDNSIPVILAEHLDEEIEHCKLTCRSGATNRDDRNDDNRNICQRRFLLIDQYEIFLSRRYDNRKDVVLTYTFTGAPVAGRLSHLQEIQFYALLRHEQLRLWNIAVSPQTPLPSTLVFRGTDERKCYNVWYKFVPHINLLPSHYRDIRQATLRLFEDTCSALFWQRFIHTCFQHEQEEQMKREKLTARTMTNVNGKSTTTTSSSFTRMTTTTNDRHSPKSIAFVVNLDLMCTSDERRLLELAELNVIASKNNNSNNSNDRSDRNTRHSAISSSNGVTITETTKALAEYGNRILRRFKRFAAFLARVTDIIQRLRLLHAPDVYWTCTDDQRKIIRWLRCTMTKEYLVAEREMIMYHDRFIQLQNPNSVVTNNDESSLICSLSSDDSTDETTNYRDHSSSLLMTVRSNCAMLRKQSSPQLLHQISSIVHNNNNKLNTINHKEPLVATNLANENGDNILGIFYETLINPNFMFHSSNVYALGNRTTYVVKSFAHKAKIAPTTKTTTTSTSRTATRRSKLHEMLSLVPIIRPYPPPSPRSPRSHQPPQAAAAVLSAPPPPVPTQLQSSTLTQTLPLQRLASVLSPTTPPTTLSQQRQKHTQPMKAVTTATTLSPPPCSLKSTSWLPRTTMTMTTRRTTATNGTTMTFRDEESQYKNDTSSLLNIVEDTNTHIMIDADNINNHNALSVTSHNPAPPVYKLRDFEY